MRLVILLATATAMLGPARAEGAEVRSPKLLNIEEVFKVEDYPLSAARNGVEGTTNVDVLVGRDGLVLSCMIAKSSGSAALDEQSCALLRSRARFASARDAGGRSIEGHYTKDVTWRLEGDAKDTGMPRQAHFTRITNRMNAQGQLVGCTMEAIGVQTEPDPCAAFAKSDEFAKMTAEQKKVVGESVIEVQFVPIEYGKAAVPPLRTDMQFVGRQIIRIEAEPNGDVVLCEVVETKGEAQDENLMCQQEANLRFVADPKSKTLKGTVIVSGYMRLIQVI